MGVLLLLPLPSSGIGGVGAPSPKGALRARLLRIEDTRRDEPGYLDALLADRDPTIRALAATSAGRIGGITHLGRLRALASDADTAVAANALFSLGLLKDSRTRARGSPHSMPTPPSSFVEVSQRAL